MRLLQRIIGTLPSTSVAPIMAWQLSRLVVGCDIVDLGSQHHAVLKQALAPGPTAGSKGNT